MEENTLKTLITDLLEVPLTSFLHYRQYSNINFSKILNSIIIKYLNNILLNHKIKHFNHQTKEILLPLLLMCKMEDNHADLNKLYCYNDQYKAMIQQYKNQIIDILLTKLEELEIMAMHDTMSGDLQNILDDIDDSYYFEDKVDKFIEQDRHARKKYMKLLFFGNINNIDIERNQEIVKKYLIGFLKFFYNNKLIEAEINSLSLKKIDINHLKKEINNNKQIKTYDIMQKYSSLIEFCLETFNKKNDNEKKLYLNMIIYDKDWVIIENKKSVKRKKIIDVIAIPITVLGSGIFLFKRLLPNSPVTRTLLKQYPSLNHPHANKVLLGATFFGLVGYGLSHYLSKKQKKQPKTDDKIQEVRE